MEDNKDYTTEKIEISKNKFTFIGFIIGIIPFILLLSFLSLYEGGINEIPNLFRNIIVIAGVFTSVINSYVLRKMLTNRLEDRTF